MKETGLKVEICPVEQRDIRLLESLSGPPEKHLQRLVLQRLDEAIYLIAYLADLPLGHAFVKWAGTAKEPTAPQIPDCPDLEDLFVRADYRSKGIGSQLLAGTEGWARSKGYRRIGLGVGVDNTQAHQLYLRSGYRDSGLGLYPHRVHYHDSKGHHRTRIEICIYLVKELEP